MSKEIPTPISEFPDRSSGHFEQLGNKSGYFVGVKLDVGLTTQEFSHPGSDTLDAIQAFDTAETNGPYVGQLNFEKASSFTAAPPDGMLLGYDILKPSSGYTTHPLIPSGVVGYHSQQVEVFDARSLTEVTQQVFGTREHLKYPIKAGSHTIVAYKSLEEKGPTHLYSAVGIAIPRDRGTDRAHEPAILFMEDAGRIMTDGTEEKILELKRFIVESMVKSCIKISENHPDNVRYERVFVGVSDIVVPEGYVGSALVAMPYFALAQRAVPTEGISALQQMSIEEWLEKQNNG